jgi:SPP1 gp7 family putative phage head morphogenesis protein
MKINRLEMLKANIGLETIAGHDELEKFMGGILKGRTEDELRRQAGILGKTIRNNAAKADAIVNGSFHSGTFSDRIWQYQDLMRQDLGKLLQQGLIQGKGARAITKDLRKYLIGEKQGKGATYNVERLMRTELARVQTEAQKQSFIRNGFTMYEFICNHHASKHGTCDICQGLNGKHFKVDKMMPGENAPPMHPHCRCSTAAWEDDAEYEAWLDFLESGGTTAEWNATGRAEWEKSKKVLENSKKGSTIEAGAILGAYNSRNDADGSKRDAHAERYYESMRNRKNAPVVSAISQNTGISKEKVSKMFDHLFINKYDLHKGHTRFDSDYNIAESVRRLLDGKSILEHDKILVMHEAMEYDLMNKNGLSYEEAHSLANKSYNYEKALYKWLDETESW